MQSSRHGDGLAGNPEGQAFHGSPATLRAPGQVRCFWFWLEKPVHPLLSTDAPHSHTQTPGETTRGRTASHKDLSSVLLTFGRKKLVDFPSLFLHVFHLFLTPVTFVPVSTGSPKDHCASVEQREPKPDL